MRDQEENGEEGQGGDGGRGGGAKTRKIMGVEELVFLPVGFR